jgi:hypothetical protein
MNQHDPADKPLIGTIVDESSSITDPSESQGFAEAISRRYQESLWGKGPATIAVDLGLTERRLEEKRRLYRLRAKNNRRDLLTFLPGLVLQLFIAVLLSNIAADPWSFGVVFAWVLAALEAAWTVKLFRDWRKAVQRCEDLK